MIKSTAYFATTVSAVFAFAGGVSYSPFSLAQEETDSILEEVIVTASRREESLQNVALAMAVVKPEKFIDAGLSNLTDILAFVPGVSAQDGGSIFGNPVYEGIIGNFDNVNELFEDKLSEIVEEMAQAFCLRKAA